MRTLRILDLFCGAGGCETEDAMDDDRRIEVWTCPICGRDASYETEHDSDGYCYADYPDDENDIDESEGA